MEVSRLFLSHLYLHRQLDVTAFCRTCIFILFWYGLLRFIIVFVFIKNNTVNLIIIIFEACDFSIQRFQEGKKSQVGRTAAGGAGALLD